MSCTIHSYTTDWGPLPWTRLSHPHSTWFAINRLFLIKDTVLQFVPWKRQQWQLIFRNQYTDTRIRPRTDFLLCMCGWVGGVSEKGAIVRFGGKYFLTVDMRENMFYRFFPFFRPGFWKTLSWWWDSESLVPEALKAVGKSESVALGYVLCNSSGLLLYKQ